MKYFWRSGFIWKVECTFAEFAGGECGRCGGQGGERYERPKEFGGLNVGWAECHACSGTGRTPGIAESLVWRAELTCPACGGVGDRYWEKGSPYRDVDSRCPACEDGTGRVPNPDPPPPTAQPVTRVVIPATDIPDGLLEITVAADGRTRKFTHPDYPGVTVERPGAILPTHPHHGIGQPGTGYWGPSSH
jgi:hypothetical protein